jgi:hypothetical protein
MMMRSTSHQSASIAAETNWRASLGRDTSLVRPCAAAAGPAVAANPATEGNQR